MAWNFDAKTTPHQPLQHRQTQQYQQRAFDHLKIRPPASAKTATQDRYKKKPEIPSGLLAVAERYRMSSPNVVYSLVYSYVKTRTPPVLAFNRFMTEVRGPILDGIITAANYKNAIEQKLTGKRF